MSLRNIGDCNNRYFREMDRYPERISRDESIELARKAQAGDELAKDRLIGCHLRYVVKEAGKWVRNGRTLDDMIQYGNLGLMNALGTFDPDMGYHFLTHARWYVRLSIQRGCSRSGHVCVPMGAYSHDIGCKENVEAAGRAKGRPVELNAPITEGSDLTRLDLMVGSLPCPDELADEGSLCRAVDRAKDDSLDVRERLIVDRFMDGRTAVGSAEILGLSCERIRQLKLRAFKKLLPRLEKDALLRMGA